MWFHLFVITIIILLAMLFFSKKQTLRKRRIYLILVFLILFFISAFRSVNIGNDTLSYAIMFQRFGKADNIFTLDTNIEIGYIVLNKILYSISSNPQILFIFTSLFILVTQLRFINKNSNMVWLSVYLFINLRLFYFTLSGLRQSIAMSIILLSYNFIKSKKPIKFFITVVIASLFHSSALVFLIIYPISKIKFSKKIIILEFIVGIFVYIGFDYIINLGLKFFPKYSPYLTSVYFDGDVRLASILNLLVISVILILGLITKYHQNIEENHYINEIGANNKFTKYDEHNLHMHIILIATIFSLIALRASLIDRFGTYFFMFSIIFIPRVIGKLKDRKLKIMITYLVLVFTLAYNFIVLIYRPEWQHVYPYEFFWQI